MNKGLQLTLDNVFRKYHVTVKKTRIFYRLPNSQKQLFLVKLRFALNLSRPTAALYHSLFPILIPSVKLLRNSPQGLLI